MVVEILRGRERGEGGLPRTPGKAPKGPPKEGWKKRKKKATPERRIV